MSTTINNTNSLSDAQKNLDILLFSLDARRNAEAEYLVNPTNTDNLTRWGEALLDLAPFVDINQSKELLTDAMSKLNEALTIDPKKHEALWCLGKVCNANAFLTYDDDEAKIHFELAAEYYQKAANENPENELYKGSLELCVKAPELRKEAHGRRRSAASGSGKKKTRDQTYDIFGWIILGVGLAAWVVRMPKSS